MRIPGIFVSVTLVLLHLIGCRMDPGPQQYHFQGGAPNALRDHNNLQYKFPGLAYTDILAFRVPENADKNSGVLSLDHFLKSDGHVLHDAHRADLYVALALRPVGFQKLIMDCFTASFAFVYFQNDSPVAAIYLDLECKTVRFVPDSKILIGIPGMERIQTIFSEMGWD